MTVWAYGAVGLRRVRVWIWDTRIAETNFFTTPESRVDSGKK
jgi:hypothetical protein